MMQINTVWIIVFLTRFLPLGSSQSISVITKLVPRGGSVTLTYPLKSDDNGTTPVWKFNDVTVYAEGYIVPCEVNFCNMRGENTMGTSYLHIERFSLTNVGNYTCSINTLRKQYNLEIVDIPMLSFKVNDRPVNGIYQTHKGKELSLVCIAVNSFPGVSLTFSHDNLESVIQNATDITQKENQFNKSTVDTAVSVVNVTVLDDVNITCHLTYGQFSDLQNLTVSVKVIPAVANNSTVVLSTEDILFIAVALTLVVLIFNSVFLVIYCVKRKVKEKPKKDTDLSLKPNKGDQQETESDAANPGGFVSDIPSDTTMPISFYGSLNIKEETDLDNLLDWKTESDEILKDNVELISLMSSGNFFDYWKASSGIPSMNDCIIAKTVSDNAQMKDVYNFITIATRMRQLSSHPNIIKCFGCSLEQVPYFIYQELLENGTLRDTLLGIGDAHSHLLNRDGKNGELNTIAHLVCFAKGVSSGLEYLHMNKLCHPGLMSKKILLDASYNCKLFDFWPVEISSYRLTKLLSNRNPPIGWFPPETIFINQYDIVSDVWSFGVLLWEIFSFGEVPYQQETIHEIEENVRRLNVLPRPPFCPGSTFSIMLSAWTQTRETRPSMSDLKGKIDDISLECLPVIRIWFHL
ncbi:uncharacterized protein [Apostichopus japonicus]|uniref:uncharacterized protein isoform X2 n=1 Tax=Stichopus japonicus TaxID=307972 RepID=UPI003AB66FF8